VAVRWLTRWFLRPLAAWWRRVGEGEQQRRAVIVWWPGGRLPERDPTPFVRATRAGS